MTFSMKCIERTIYYFTNWNATLSVFIHIYHPVYISPN